MISDLDNTLETLLKTEVKGMSGIAYSFGPPDNEFQKGVGPNVNLFLYDIRENRELRDNEVIAERTYSNGRMMASQRQAPVRVDCSYLITVWVSDATQERNLLSQVMRVLLRFPVLPVNVLQGELKNQELPLPTSALQPGHLQSMGEFWQALGGKLKTALHYTVTIGVDLNDDEAGAQVVTEKVLHFTVGNGGA